MNKINIARKTITIISLIYFISFYVLLRQIDYYESFYEEVYDAARFQGPLLGMLIMCPQAYLMMILAVRLHFLKANRDVVKPLMRMWIAIFVFGASHLLGPAEQQRDPFC
ncbi:hypothetical protein [Rhizobium binae]|uniref:hypothetical protein n=1 Tax=Rhizobium binae TaxID=1138190 RepID=UPI0014428310|nr:hypothetical protein [Rhizobium binae]NKL48507.1 hypothetical protein [Rhizobium leguminosarum bv. viciae]QSY81575.1 hypothetical protein J2J99_18270 [Rhizobium binae]